MSQQKAMKLYDVAVIGAGPAGSQAAISAAHQMRSVLVLDAGQVSQSKGRAYWSKSVEIEDAPVFGGITGPKFARELRTWLESRPMTRITIGGENRWTGIDIQGGMVLKLRQLTDDELNNIKQSGQLEVLDDGFQGEGPVFALETSITPLAKDGTFETEVFLARAVVVASGFEDGWPEIEVDESAERMFERYRTVFRYAGNAKGWHLCIRCDGHLHVDRHMALLGVGDSIYGASLGAQDFTDKITILTNGRPHGFSPAVLRQAKERGIEIIETPIVKHIGKGTNLTGLLFEDGSELYFDGFLVDEGLVPNTAFLQGWDVQTDEEGLLVVDEDGQVLDGSGQPVPGLFAAGDIVADERNQIATAFGLGQNAGLSASDSLRKWKWPEDD